MTRARLLVAAVVAAFVMTGTATAVAKPTPLYSTAGGWSCTHGASDRTGSSFGTASINVDGTGGSATVDGAPPQCGTEHDLRARDHADHRLDLLHPVAVCDPDDE